MTLKTWEEKLDYSESDTGVVLLLAAAWCWAGLGAVQTQRQHTVVLAPYSQLWELANTLLESCRPRGSGEGAYLQTLAVALSRSQTGSRPPLHMNPLTHLGTSALCCGLQTLLMVMALLLPM